jgi:hypothetical protein
MNGNHDILRSLENTRENSTVVVILNMLVLLLFNHDGGKKSTNISYVSIKIITDTISITRITIALLLLLLLSQLLLCNLGYFLKNDISMVFVYFICL